MADSIANFDITIGDIAYVLFVKGTISLCKGVMNVLHIRRPHQCEYCQERYLDEQIERAEKNGEMCV
jgi:hypothetical protein